MKFVVKVIQGGYTDPLPGFSITSQALSRFYVIVIDYGLVVIAVNTYLGHLAPRSYFSLAPVFCSSRWLQCSDF